MRCYEIIYKFEDMEAEVRVLVENLNVKDAIANGIEILKGGGIDITERYCSVMAIPFPTTDEVILEGEPF